MRFGESRPGTPLRDKVPRRVGTYAHLRAGPPGRHPVTKPSLDLERSTLRAHAEERRAVPVRDRHGVAEDRLSGGWAYAGLPAARAAGDRDLGVPGAEWRAAVVPRRCGRRRSCAARRVQCAAGSTVSAWMSRFTGRRSLRRVPGTGRAPDRPPLPRSATHVYEAVPRLSTGDGPDASENRSATSTETSSQAAQPGARPASGVPPAAPPTAVATAPARVDGGAP
jgi:hypothetical protein